MNVKSQTQQMFLIQEHHASLLHYDLRLEVGGVLKSWAMVKAPSLKSTSKHLAIQTEDHSITEKLFSNPYLDSEYGSGQSLSWDQGLWESSTEPVQGLKSGRLDFTLKGSKLKGNWTLLRIGTKGRKQNWVLFKCTDFRINAINLMGREEIQAGLTQATACSTCTHL